MFSRSFLGGGYLRFLKNETKSRYLLLFYNFIKSTAQSVFAGVIIAGIVFIIDKICEAFGIVDISIIRFFTVGFCFFISLYIFERAKDFYEVVLQAVIVCIILVLFFGLP